ncbi:hypothetical protein PRZ48_012406 [Zasmidium cellare]|uniref:Uncharacterized protein n=1 Tax=Zasmidium cellare TaxID=395010 RepID=A0ABR0E4S6_ZASCE|nr:hypothetical protein PRZ48_012406 [Zasmidium cellare]
MPPLITGLNDAEVRWSKFKNSYMYNDTYYLRRTKFVIYQCATTGVGVCAGIAGPLIHRYNRTREYTIDAYPDVRVDMNDIIVVLGLNIAASGLIGTMFTPAIFFDLFWPERWEAPIIQRLWRWGAATSSALQLAAAITLTIVMATSHVSIAADGAQEWRAARAIWSDKTYNYENSLAIATVVFSWIGVVFTIWRHGPFNNRIVKQADESGIVTDESELAMTV